MHAGRAAWILQAVARGGKKAESDIGIGYRIAIAGRSGK